MHLSDDELRDYLEGRTTPEAARRLETAMLGDASLERRLMALDDVAAGIRSGMAALPEDARIARISEGAGLSVAPARPVERGPRLLFRLAASLLLGLGLGWGTTQMFMPADDWRMEVAHYQALYTDHTLSGASFDTPALQAQLARASEMVGTALPPEVLSGLVDMDLVRAQVLGFEDQPLAQIVYRGVGGAPIALCLLRTGAAEAGIEVSDLRGMAAASWNDRGVEYLLIGGSDQTWIEDRAVQIRSALRSRS